MNSSAGFNLDDALAHDRGFFHSPYCDREERSADRLPDIRPYFQPIVTSHRHHLYAVEALMRLPGVSTSCDELFPHWEATGEVAAIDIAMVRQVTAAVHSATIAPHIVSVNVSAFTVITSPDAYLAEVIALAAEVDHVIVEITETYPIADRRELVAFARKCEAIGVFLALDDCTPGHEFCTESLVQEVRPHIMKIDGPLFIDCYTHNLVKPLFEIIRLSRSVGAQTVAEHVSTRDMRDWASRLGVGLLQGFYFGPAEPLASDKLEATEI